MIRVNLTLDPVVYQRLKKLSAQKRRSVSDLTREYLRRAVDAELSETDEPEDLVTRIRRMRNESAPCSDSTEVVRASRDQGWR